MMQGKRIRNGKIIIAALCFAVVALIVVLITVLFGKSKKNSPELVLRYAENQAEDYPTSLGAFYFAKLVEERTNGRIQILVYPGGALGREADVIKQMQYGGIDFARVSISQLGETSPKLNVLQMPYIYNSSEHMWSVLDGEIGNLFLEEMNDYGLVGLSWYDAGTRNFYSSVKPISCLEDLKGMRIRVQESNLMEDMVSSLGAIPVPISYEDVYSALEMGTVDGAENNWPSYESVKHYEVAKYWTEDEHTRVPEIQLCSEATWNLLSEEDRNIILQAAKESALYERTLWAEREKTAKDIALSGGTIVTELSDEEIARFREAMEDVYAKYCKNYMGILNEIIKR